MHSLSKPILALALVGSLASASSILPTPSLTTSVVSGTSIAPVATGQAALNTNQLVGHHGIDDLRTPRRGKGYVGHSKNKVELAKQGELAKKLVPVSLHCPDFRAGKKIGMNYLDPKVNDAVQKVTVEMEQVKSFPLTIQVTIANNGTGPITFWTDLSPISSFALELGHFHFETGADAVQFGKRLVGPNHGYRPESYSDLTEVPAGKSVSAYLELPRNSDNPRLKSWFKMLELAGDASVTMSGSWYGIWAGSKKEVMLTDMDDDLEGRDFWNNLYIPWKAGFPNAKWVDGKGPAMRLDLDKLHGSKAGKGS
ncbi:hypothetical protein FMEXI_2969 [Fusarium mexicanum]|uniref:Uncharacterized protein n=1 Tax=Fusarium mexicanum TaxID=751941 RepID=A0A8H5N592_9HYPO|nr:hypothetical protein FMEXI_2969 [Fusarium mexicanum]